MIATTCLSPTPSLYFSKTSTSWSPRSCPLWPSTSRVTAQGIPERHLTNGHKDRLVPGEICWSYPEISDLEIQDLSSLTDIIILKCKHWIDNVLWVWSDLARCFPQLDFNSFGVRAVLACSFLVPCVRSRELLQSFLIILGPSFFTMKTAMYHQSKSLGELSWEEWLLVE